MMLKKLLIFSFLFIFLVSLSGCATGRKQSDLEIQGLKNQISALEAQVQEKDTEISSLKESASGQQPVQEVQVSAPKVVTKKIAVPELKSRPKPKHIQIALKNAGFDPGPIDGKMGKRTIEALKAFQRNHNLPADGKAGKKTWSLLKVFLYQKLK
jgi:hypothetical protein